MKRTQYCGALRESDVGRTATVMGWAENKRDMGGVIFVDLRDREGTLQVVFDARNLTREEFAAAEKLRTESVVAVTGPLRIRSEETYNPRLQTGTIELAAHSLEVLSEAETLPFQLDDGVREELRLKYRFLDLRRPAMLRNLKTRAEVVRVASEFLDGDGFIQIETPMLTKSTPEGARDYLVPSRVHPGSFYALPQSPQIFKQLLMVGGVDKYYQVARCFRDEDLRADRQPEFTQVDMEMSFVEQEDILAMLERLFKYIFKAVLDAELPAFRRLTWRESMDAYGVDKPDLRFGLTITDLTDGLRDCGFSVFRKVIDGGGIVRAINVRAADRQAAHGGAGHEEFTRSEIEQLTEKAQGYGAGGMAWIAVRPDGTPYSILTKYFSDDEFKALLTAMDAGPGDFILFCADRPATVCRTLGGLRLDVAALLELRDKEEYAFCFVTDFPQFEYSEEENRWLAMHHPFTMPYPEDVPFLQSDPGRVRAQAYDVVLNGTELGSGSIRIHNSKIQQAMFEALGFTPEQIQERFGFMVNAFRYGTPPHGGFAFGLDRLVMLMTGAESLREIIAFPKTKDAGCPLTGAPEPVDAEQLEALGLTAEALAASAAAGAGESKKKAERTINVDAVADLARLKVRDGEKEALAAEMAGIVAFADKLASLDTTGVAVTESIVPLYNVFRADEPCPSFDRDRLLAGAPEQRDGCFYVPQVVE